MTKMTVAHFDQLVNLIRETIANMNSDMDVELDLHDHIELQKSLGVSPRRIRLDLIELISAEPRESWLSSVRPYCDYDDIDAAMKRAVKKLLAE